MDYRDFVVRIGAGADGLRVRVIESPEGQGAEAPFRSPFSTEEVDALAARVADSSRSGRLRAGRHLLALVGWREPDPEWAVDAGERLFRALLPEPLLDLWRYSIRGIRQEPATGLRIKLRLDLNEIHGGAGGVDLHRLPWELLRDPSPGRFLALSRRTPVVRYLEVPRPGGRRPPPTPLVVLAAASSPRPARFYPTLDLAGEREGLAEALRRREEVELRSLDRATLDALEEALRDGDVHVVHFMGHGDFDPDGGRGLLVFESDAGGPEPVPADRLLSRLEDSLAGVRLVFLNACRTAEAGAAAPYAGVATALVEAGVGAVVAMRHPVGDRAAVVFSREVYRRLAQGYAVDEAVTDGRRAVARELPGSLEWATPALFLRVADGRLFAAEATRGRGRQRAGAAALVAALGLAGIAGLRYRSDSTGTASGPDREAAETARTPTPHPGPGGGSEPETTAAEAAGEADPTPARPAIRELTDGEPVRFPEVRARVTASFLQLQGRELVRLTVDPDGGEVQRAVTFGSETRHFRVGGELLSLHVGAVDWRARRVPARAARCAVSEPGCGPDG